MEKLKQNPIVKKLGLNRILLVCILILMFVVFKVVLGSKFPVGDSIKSTLNYVYFLGFLSLGVTFVIATGGIDFSIGPVMFCCALVSGYCMTSYKVPCAAAMVICVLIGLAFGIFNGWLVSYLSVPAFIVSMASMNIAKGIASVFTKTQSVSWPLGSDPVNGWFRNIVSYKGFPVGLVIFLGMQQLYVELFFTIQNRDVISSALDPTAKQFDFPVLDTKKWNMLAYVICGVPGRNRSTVLRSYIYNRSAWLWRSVQQRSNRRLCNGWYIHGWWTCFHRRYCNRCIYYLSSAAGNHGIWSW